MITIPPQYGVLANLDCDTQRFFEHFDEPPGSLILEVGANEEPSANILTDNGYRVIGVDLRPCGDTHQYTRIEGDFVQVAPLLIPVSFDSCFSTSAIEHFGLVVYGQKKPEPDYDIQTMLWIYWILKTNGTCYITVPYGKDFLTEGDWRVYNKAALQARIIQDFVVEKKFFFLSGGCSCPNNNNDVEEADADQWCGIPPHVTVFLKLRKS